MAIGQKLEEARKRKGISLREASESTTIRGDYLSAFESDQFDLNLPEVYLRGFVRTYAAYLDLDQEAIIAELEIGVGKTKLRNTKKSLGSIAAGEIPETSEIRSSGQSKAKGNFRSENHFNLRKPLIFVTAGISLLIITIVFFTFIDFSNEKEKISPLTNDDLDEQTVQEIKKVGSSVIQSDSHLLRIKAVGPIKKLIVMTDKEMESKDIHEYDNLTTEWVEEIKFTKSFQCYSSAVENIRFAVDEGLEKKVGGEGAGSFIFDLK